MKRTLAFFLICSLLLFPVGCNDNTTNQVLTMEVDAIPQTLDPLLASTQSEILVMQHLFDPLFSLGEEGEVTAASAEGYAFSQDGLTCTVTLREDLMWSDGQPVTAADFAFALRRAADPVTKATCATGLGCIQGASDILAGKKPLSSLGVEARDERTLIIDLVSPGNSILAVLSGAAGMPCREDFFYDCGGRYGMDRESIVTNGMFAIQGWSGEEPDVYIRLTRFDDFYGESQVSPAGLYFTVGDVDTRLTRLSENKIDGGVIPGEQAALYEKEGYSTLSSVQTGYSLLFNTKNDHVFANDQLRKAMVGAVDASGIAEYLPSYCDVAQGITLPGSYYGVTPYVSAGYQMTGLQKKATENFTLAMDQVGADAVQSFTLLYIEQDGLRSALDYVVQSWQKTFGVYVTLTPVSLSAMESAVKQGTFDMAVYPVAGREDSSLSVFSRFAESGQEVLGGFTQEEYDALLEKAVADEDGIGYQQDCETYLLSNAVVLPLYTTKSFYVFSEDCTGMAIHPYHRGLQLKNMKKEG